MSTIHKLTRAALAAGVVFGVTMGQAMAAYPERPIQLLVPWGAGGGSDAVARIIASELEKDLGQPVAVINRAGGNGVVGHQAIASAKPDGYTIGMLTMEITTMHWLGLSPLRSTDYSVIGQVNFDPAAITVKYDAPYKDANELLEAIKQSPGKLKSSGGGVGSIPHVGVVGMLKAAGLAPSDVPFVPSDSAASGLQELMAGGVDIVGSSLGETRSLVEAERVRPLAVVADERLQGFDEIPTLKEATGLDWSYSTWRGFAGPKGMPEDVVKKLEASLEKAYNSQEYQDFMTNRGFGMKWRDSSDFAAFMLEADKQNGEMLEEIGLAKK